MDWLDDILGMIGITAVDKTIEQSNNEILFDNFIAQAQPKNILTLIPNCKAKIPMFLFGSLFGDTNIDDSYIKRAYLDLYDYLEAKNVIESKLELSSLFTWSRKRTINPILINKSDLERLLSSNTENFPELLKCYKIDYAKLSELLKNYNYNMTDEITALANGGKNKKHTKSKSKKSKSKKRKSKKSK